MALSAHASFGAGNSLWADALAGEGNIGYWINWDKNVGTNDNSLVSTSYSAVYNGLDSMGNAQTMSFTGAASAQSDYGSLHVWTSGTVTNTYSNPGANAVYYDNNTVNTAGSPDTLATLTFATFNDTLQFGGALQSGYMAKYIFHVDGTNTGDGLLADLAFNVDGVGNSSFFNNTPGYTSQDWVTNEVAVNGVTPQQISVQFSNQFVIDTFSSAFPEGGTYSGTSDFSETLKLVGIEVVDANGNPVDGWTVTSSSGTKYAHYAATPGPAAVLPFLLGLAGRVRSRRKRS